MNDRAAGTPDLRGRALTCEESAISPDQLPALTLAQRQERGAVLAADAPDQPRPTAAGRAKLDKLSTADTFVRALGPPPATIASFDADPHPLFEQDSVPQPMRPARRRGRPRGSRSRVLAAGEAGISAVDAGTLVGGGRIGADDLALLRAWLMGVPLARAGRSYLDCAATSSAARDAHLQRLFARLRAAALQLPDAPRAVALVEELLGAHPTVSQESVNPSPASAMADRARPIQARAPALPTLEEFAQRFDPDMYSERELLELYEQEFPAKQAGAADGVVLPPAQSQAGRHPSAAGLLALPYSGLARKLAILDALAPQLADAAGGPTAQAPLQAWLVAPLAKRLHECLGVQTLGQLVAAVNARGRWWHRQVPGLGRLRAARLVLWLAHHARAIGVPVEAGLLKAAAVRAGENVKRHDETARAGTGQGRARDAAAMMARPLLPAESASAASVHALAHETVAPLSPLPQLAWPPQLLGVNGTFRSAGPNTLGARDDREAVALWLAAHLKGKSGATDRVYRRAVERLVLWALCERGRALSSLTTTDFLTFKAFLYQPPAHWCGSERVVRESPDWRPMRGPLSSTAVAQVLGIVQQMFAGWQAAGYLAANTAAAVAPRMQVQPSAPAQRSACGLDVSRAFSAKDLEAMRQGLARLRDGPARRRLRAILLLLLSTGLRRNELQSLTFGTLRPACASGEGTAGDCLLQICGRGGRLREVIVPAAVVQALQAHYADRQALAVAGVLAPRLLSMPQSDAPLLGVLRHVRASGHAGVGDSTAAAARTPSRNGALAGASVYTIVKAFFADVARSQLGQGRAAFERASTHWLRHSFAHAALVGEKHRLPHVQAMLGHSDMRTTCLYLKGGVHDLAAAAPLHAAL